MQVGDLYENHAHGIIVRITGINEEGYVIFEIVNQELVLNRHKSKFESEFRKLTPLEKELHEA
jgi:hypothetical protein